MASWLSCIAPDYLVLLLCVQQAPLFYLWASHGLSERLVWMCKLALLGHVIMSIRRVAAAMYGPVLAAYHVMQGQPRHVLSGWTGTKHMLLHASLLRMSAATQTVGLDRLWVCRHAHPEFDLDLHARGALFLV